MTREEQAIEVIKAYRDKLTNSASNQLDGDIEAFEMAIQALEKENIYDDKEHYVTISKALYDKLNIDYEKALSQEPCDDAISREWLMRKATERFYTTNYFNHISAMIEEAPSVTPSVTRDIEKSNFSQEQYLLDTDTAYKIGYEQGKKDSRRKGHWLKTGQSFLNPNKFRNFCCTECSHELDEHIRKEPKYCPNCGAKMVEPQESEE